MRDHAPPGFRNTMYFVLIEICDGECHYDNHDVLERELVNGINEHWYRVKRAKRALVDITTSRSFSPPHDVTEKITRTSRLQTFDQRFFFNNTMTSPLGVFDIPIAWHWKSTRHYHVIKKTVGKKVGISSQWRQHWRWRFGLLRKEGWRREEAPPPPPRPSSSPAPLPAADYTVYRSRERRINEYILVFTSFRVCAGGRMLVFVSLRYRGTDFIILPRWNTRALRMNSSHIITGKPVLVHRLNAER